MSGDRTRRSAARRRAGPRFRMTVLRLTRRAVHPPATGRFFPQAPFSSRSCGGQSGHESAGGKAHRSRGRLVEGVVRRLHRRHGPHTGTRFPRRPVRVGVGSRGRRRARRGGGADPAPGPVGSTALRRGVDRSGAPDGSRRRTGHAPPERPAPAARPLGAAPGPAPRPHEFPDGGETPGTHRAATRPGPPGRPPGRHSPADRPPHASGHEPAPGRPRQGFGPGDGWWAHALSGPAWAPALSRPSCVLGREPSRGRRWQGRG